MELPNSRAQAALAELLAGEPETPLKHRETGMEPETTVRRATKLTNHLHGSSFGGGASRRRCGVETRRAWGASIGATTAVARVHRGFIDLTRPGEGFEIMYHFI
jgi:hypothetical protein